MPVPPALDRGRPRLHYAPPEFPCGGNHVVEALGVILPRQFPPAEDPVIRELGEFNTLFHEWVIRRGRAVSVIRRPLVSLCSATFPADLPENFRVVHPGFAVRLAPGIEHIAERRASRLANLGDEIDDPAGPVPCLPHIFALPANRLSCPCARVGGVGERGRNQMAGGRNCRCSVHVARRLLIGIRMGAAGTVVHINGTQQCSHHEDDKIPSRVFRHASKGIIGLGGASGNA
mmetsp:Transcript_4784/g.10274  ORF Transcript_4784/g.10274 Transcript_4784/m.10274 type:complete len:232 (-) Transcript_4784:588-1283(-)